MNTDIVQQTQPVRNLQPYAINEVEGSLFIDHNSGEVFASYRGLARLLGIDEATVRRSSIITANKSNIKKAEVPTTSGLQSAALVPETIIGKAMTKYNPALWEACGFAGLRVFLHKTAGFAVTSEAVAPIKSDRELYLEEKLKNAELLLEVAETKKLMAEKEAYILKSVVDRPGLKNIMEDSQEPHLRLPGDRQSQTTWTVQEWMEDTQEIQLTGRKFRQLVSKVHGAYKALRHKDPEKEYRPQLTNPKALKLVQVYEINDFCILTQCYLKTLIEGVH